MPTVVEEVVFAPDLLTPLVTTNDPTGANALFLVNLGDGANTLQVYTPDQTGVVVRVSAATVPEPSAASFLRANR